MRKINLLAVIAAALMALSLPALASAQGSYDPWYGRDRDRDYRRNDDYRRNGNYDYGRYDYRTVRDSVRRLNDLSRRLQNDLDHTLDRGRENGSRHEDRLNDLARQFRDAAGDLKNRFGDGRDLYRSENEARHVLDLSQTVEQRIRHHFNDQRIYNDWSQISSELNIIADAYGYNGGYYNNGGYGNDPYYRNDPYRNDDRYRRRSGVNWGDILRRIP